jgi:hypothetical protein
VKILLDHYLNRLNQNLFFVVCLTLIFVGTRTEIALFTLLLKQKFKKVIKTDHNDLRMIQKMNISFQLETNNLNISFHK